MKLEIPSRSHHCAILGEPLTPGMEYYSELKEDGNGNWIRTDYCPTCWQKKENKPTIYWKSVIPVSLREKKNENLSTDKDLLEILKNFVHTETEKEKAFMLALFLARKRKLALRQEVKNDLNKQIYLFEILQSEEMLPIEVVPLSQVQIQEINRYFSELSKEK